MISERFLKAVDLHVGKECYEWWCFAASCCSPDSVQTKENKKKVLEKPLKEQKFSGLAFFSLKPDRKLHWPSWKQRI